MITTCQLTVGEHHFNYRTCGSGPDVLLIHGWVSSSRMWEGAMRHLAPYYRLWAIDLMGFGDSRTHNVSLSLTIEDQTRLIIEFCQALRIRPYAVIGHSMGGTIALQLALDHPEWLDKLGLVCPVVTGQFRMNLGTILATPLGRRLLSLGAGVWPRLKHLPGMSFFVAPRYLHPDVIRRSTEDFQKATWAAAYHGLVSLVNIRLDRRLHEIAKPTIIITGAHDLSVPPVEARIAAGAIPGAQFVEFSTSHHQPPDEEPDRFHEALRRFLVEPAGPGAQSRDTQDLLQRAHIA